MTFTTQTVSELEKLNPERETLRILQQLQTLYEENPLPDSVPLLPLLNLDRKPMTLRNHYMFRPMYQFARPRRSLFKTARQMGKTTNTGASNILNSAVLNRGYRTLFVCPRFEQVRRLSTDTIRPLVMHSILSGSIRDKTCDDNVLQRSYLSESKQFFSFAFLQAERLRGYSGICECNIDEAQDINWEFIPIIGETMSAVPEYGFFTFTGTPKSFDNTLQKLWEDSSMAEWIIKCDHCRKDNIPSVEYHLLKMIGKTGVICAYCGKPLNCRNGMYIPRVMERHTSFAGYHLPQIIHPIHYENTHMWQELLYKLANYQPYRLYNEVFGESYDSASRLITEPELRICCGDWPCSLERAVSVMNHYDVIGIGIDWGGGGGEEGLSYTALVVVGMKKNSDVIDVLYGIKMPLYINPREEIKLVTHVVSSLMQRRASTTNILLAHDYRSVGFLQEQRLLDSGVPAGMLVPFSYTVSPRQDIITYSQPSEGSTRESFSLDKPRSLVVLANMLKGGKIRLPSWNSQISDTTKGRPVCSDLLHLFSEVSERPGGADVFLVKKEPRTSDDWAHALNFACSAVWFSQMAYPNLAEANQIRLSAKDIEDICPENPNWLKLS